MALEMVNIDKEALKKEIKELKDELKRKEEIMKFPPDMLDSKENNINIDTSRIRQEASDYIKSIYETGREPHGADHGFFEVVMEAFYGEDIWTWINKHNAGL